MRQGKSSFASDFFMSHSIAREKAPRVSTPRIYKEDVQAHSVVLNYGALPPTARASNAGAGHLRPGSLRCVASDP